MVNEIKVTVLMPVFNGADFLLRDSIESILHQDFTQFEFIIIDDGSTDGSYEIIREFEQSDCRVRVIRNGENLGIVESLNRGLQASLTDVIARMDCGDFAYADRLRLQYDFLRDHQDHVLVSSQVVWTDTNDTLLCTTNLPIDDQAIRLHLFSKDNVLLHPAVMFRRLPGITYRKRSCAEDYDLWLRMSLHGKLHIIDRPLLKVRLNTNGTTYSKKIEQIKNVDAIYREFICTLNNNNKDCEFRSPELNNIELLQQKLFSYFTHCAIKVRNNSLLLYIICKLLSVTFCPVYLTFLLKSILNNKIIKYNDTYARYTQYGK